ncbi:hypothetical protein N9Y26_01125 [bacterium]|nr:hypothetical protein [bacterium]
MKNLKDWCEGGKSGSSENIEDREVLTCIFYIGNSFKLEKEGYKCIEGYSLSKEEIVAQHKDVFGIIIRSRLRIDSNFIACFSDLTFIARACVPKLPEIPPKSILRNSRFSSNARR